VVLMLAWAVMGADVSRRAADASRDAERVASYLADNNWQGSDEDYTRLLEKAQYSCETEKDRVENRYWLNTYRWRAISRERDPDTGDLLLTADHLDYTRRIVEELHAARVLCPTYGPLVSLAGQLELFVLNEPAGLGRIRTGYVLAPNHPDVVFSAAMADASTGDFAAAVAKFQRAVDLRPTMLPEAIDVFERQFDRPDLAVAVAEHGDNPSAMLMLATRLKQDPARADLAREARAAGIRKLADRCKRPEVSAPELAALAGIYRDDKNFEPAIELYRRALGLDYGQVDWRMSLARLLADTGRPGDALREAEICLRIRPGHPPAEQLVGELTLANPATGPAEKSRVMSAR